MERLEHDRESLATLAVGRLVRSPGLYPPEALAEAVGRRQRAEVAAQDLAALAALDEDDSSP